VPELNPGTKEIIGLGFLGIPKEIKNGYET
jgi:hypothetical protein